jgi:fused signal recognition particle receptor
LLCSNRQDYVMGRIKETSLLFSLQGLQQLESQRLEAERVAAERRAAEARARAAEHELREQARLEAEHADRARKEELARERERDAVRRAEALRLATLQAAREELQQKEEAERLGSIERHRLELERLRALSLRNRFAAGAVTCAVFWVATLAAGGLYYRGTLRPALERHERERHELVASRERVLSEQRRSVASFREQGERMSAALGDARETIRELREKLSRSDASPSQLRGQRLPVTIRRPPVPPASRCVDDGDPLNGCLKN